MPYPAQIDATQFADALGIQAVLTANAAQGATTLAVTALFSALSYNQILAAAGSPYIPKGSVLNFGGAKFATLAADAAIGATSLSVVATPTAMVTGDKATWSRYGRIFIPSGTLIGRTFAMRDANTPFRPADTTTPDDEIFLTYFDVVDAVNNNDVELYRPGSLVKENYLPNYANFVTNDLTQLRKLYRCIKGVD